MPCISGTFDPNIGILLDVRISPSRNDQSGTYTRMAGYGLVDTGASKTCISSKLANNLGLNPTGKVEMVGATGKKPVNSYLVDFELAFGNMSAHMGDLVVFEFGGLQNRSPFDVLIGRDVLFKGVLTTAFSNHFTFSI